jgi:integrase
MAAGIWKRNGRYRAVVYVARDKRRVTRTFDTLTDARAWRAEAKALVNRGALRAPQAVTLDEAAVAWLAGAEDGAVRTRSGQPYKPATLRGYRQALDDHVLPVFGPAKLSAITTTDLQHLVDNWQGVGLAEATIRNAVKPLQAIYRRAASRGGLPVNPTRDLELPAPRPRKAEVVEHDTAAALLAAVPDTDRAVWGTALYAGLRYGELRALRWGAVDLATGTVRVEASWDPKAGAQAPKTHTSRRTVPVPGVLRDVLLDHRLREGNDPEALVFGSDGVPFDATRLYRRADAAWKAAGLAGRLRLHQCRHTFASYMIAAGVNAKALTAYMGHSSIKVTFDLYGHLFPGNEAEAAGLLDAYLARADTAARVAQLDTDEDL